MMKEVCLRAPQECYVHDNMCWEMKGARDYGICTVTIFLCKSTGLHECHFPF